MLLASDVRIAASNARFAQIEIRRGIFPFGGATIRMPQAFGWGNAMHYLLTGVGMIHAVAMSPDGNIVAAGGWTGLVNAKPTFRQPYGSGEEPPSAGKSSVASANCRHVA